MIRLACLALVFGVLLPGTALADSPTTVTGSGRVDYNWLRKAPPDQFGVEDGATNLEGWFDLRALSRSWEAAARLRIHQSTGVEGDENREELDRRHVELRHGGLAARAGNYYQTYGNGLILRTLEQRFVTLSRQNRAFNLDRNLDGVRLRADTGPLRVSAVSGNPSRQFLSSSAAGGATDIDTDDLLQGGQGEVDVFGRGSLAAGYIQANLVSPDSLWDGRETMNLPSARARALLGPWEAEFEYAEMQPTGQMTGAFAFYQTGVARYLRASGPIGPVGISVEGKSYRNFDKYPYNQPPTLVRTHTSVLLNRSTHVLLPEDERGIQVEALYSPQYATSLIANVSTADDHSGSPQRQYREVYFSGRHEKDGLGAARLDLDWQRDRIKFKDNQWTGLLELEKFLHDGYSVLVDLELQWVDSTFGDYAWQFLQVAGSLADRWTVFVTAEHTNQSRSEKQNWVFAGVTARINRMHDVTLGYGSRPAGLVCSGGFCFESPAFDGAEFRLLSRF